MTDYVCIGPVPCEEDCVQLGSPNYVRQSTKECQKFIDLIREKLGFEPAGALLKIKWFDHEFGRYCEVIVEYDDEKENAVDYAFRCESEAPKRWKEEECTVQKLRNH